MCSSNKVTTPNNCRAAILKPNMAATCMAPYRRRYLVIIIYHSANVGTFFTKCTFIVPKNGTIPLHKCCTIFAPGVGLIVNQQNLKVSYIPFFTAIMGVVKGNAYGHGLTSVAHHLEKLGIPRLATANVKDAVTLRRSGIKCPIHVLGE